MAYAQTTKTPIDRSKTQIEHILNQRGAEKFFYAADNAQRAMVGFVIEGRPYKIKIEMSPRKDFEFSKGGRSRTQAQTQQAYDQACRAKWRAMFLLIKAKLVGIDEKCTNMETEFLAYAMLPNGSTVGEYISPQIDKLIEQKKVSLLLPGLDK